MKWTVIILFTFLLAKSSWAGTLRDDFSDGNVDGWKQVHTADRFPQLRPGEQHVENGELVIRAVNGASGIYVGDATWKDYEIQVDANITEHQFLDDEGVYFAARTRWPGVIGNYIFSLGVCGNIKCVEGWYGIADDPNPHDVKFVPWDWELNRWYRLKLVASGKRFRFYVDDVLAMEYVDDTHKVGGVGFGVQWRATTARFDNAVITGDDVPDKNLSVKMQGVLTTTWGRVRSGKL